jgi:hypothetical protein
MIKAIVTAVSRPLLGFSGHAAVSGAAAAVATAASVGVCCICCPIPHADGHPLAQWVRHTGPAAQSAVNRSVHDGGVATEREVRHGLRHVHNHIATTASGRVSRERLPKQPRKTIATTAAWLSRGREGCVSENGFACTYRATRPGSIEGAGYWRVRIIRNGRTLWYGTASVRTVNAIRPGDTVTAFGGHLFCVVPSGVVHVGSDVR